MFWPVLFTLLLLAAIAARVYIGRMAWQQKALADAQRTPRDSGDSNADRYSYRYQQPSNDGEPFPARQIRPYLTGVAIVLLFVCSASWLVASVAQVSTRNVGIVTQYGQPVGEFGNGLHFKAPYQEVTEFPGAIQTDAHVKDDSDNRYSCVTVRVARQIVACLDLSIRWRIKDGAAADLFKDYKDFDNVRASLVTRQLAAATNASMADYDPFEVDANGNLSAPPLTPTGDDIKRRMTESIGTQIDVMNVFASILHYDQATQDKLNALQAQAAETQIAKQSQQTATAQAEANKILASSITNDPNVLTAKCFDLLGQMVAKNEPIPPAFPCWPGGSSTILAPAPAATPAKK